MRLYNTLTRELEDVLTDDVRSGDRPFGMYVCGPTVQDVPHFGHARAALVPDLLRRLVEHHGIEVLHVRNITDVEDKIIDRANAEGRDPAAVSEQYARVYEAQMRRLGVLEPHIVPRATGHIIEMIELIGELVERGYAYAVDGDTPGQDVLFRVRAFEGDGTLSGRNLDDMLAGARVEPDPRKEDPADFTLWKAAKPGEPSWASPWGPGRPGWHIECSAMARKYLDGHLDVHTGGSDLIFPHHENEIAQSEAATGERFARLWLHNGMLNIDGEKMSKSLGNFITLSDALDTYGGAVLRLYFLQHHYRSIAQFSPDRLEEVQAAWRRLTTFAASAPDGGDADEAVLDRAVDALGDDLDTPELSSVLFGVVRDGNAALSGGDAAAAATARATAIAICRLVGLDPVQHAGDGPDVAPLVEVLLELRAQARQDRDFATSDRIRDALTAGGIVVEDSRDGARWRLA
ncbi:cysteine--tRNA ligase [Euzebya sp.]|uniref:cysteine--tRNA ligase n=1 Tax=Euzebya sp. TaxID=1971409 RepID=UPI0035171820